MNTTFLKRLEEMLPTMHGWCSLEKAVTLAVYVESLQPDVVVEVGVWGGRSLIPMIMAAPSKTEFHAIDPWSAPASVEGQVKPDDKEWWGAIDHELVYADFNRRVLELVNERRLDGRKIIVHRMKSDDVTPPPRISIFHCDGNHGPNALNDTRRFGANVTVGGVAVLDDLNWSGGFVNAAADWLIENGFVQLHHLGTGAVYMKMK